MHFGEYLRASFDKRNLEPLVPFEKELELVRNYLHIEQTRFGDRLKVEYDGVEGIRFLIPPLTLQPLVENGIRHGLMKKSGGGTLRIAIDSSGPDHIGVAVIDDGAGIDPARIGPLLEGAGAGGIGLYNTHRRLLHTFGQGLAIHCLPSGGTKVSLRIPIRATGEQPNRSIG
jgi:sensor histidine kinase YesM